MVAEAPSADELAASALITGGVTSGVPSQRIETSCSSGVAPAAVVARSARYWR
jgi:acetyl-CoA acetyltransferase